MHTCSDIRAQVQADAQLQGEISQALLAVADGLSTTTDPRMVRVLTRILEGSWAEHVSFQHDVLFPILIGRHRAKIEQLLEPHALDHSGLATSHCQIVHQLEELLTGANYPPVGLSALLRNTCARRLVHLKFDATLDSWLPLDVTDAEKSLCEKWSVTRHPRFPLNVLVKGERPLPRLGGTRVH